MPRSPKPTEARLYDACKTWRKRRLVVAFLSEVQKKRRMKLIMLGWSRRSLEKLIQKTLLDRFSMKEEKGKEGKIDGRRSTKTRLRRSRERGTLR